MIHHLLAISLHEDQVREGIARQQKRDLLRVFRKGNATPKPGRNAQVRTTIESQAVEHPVAMNVRQVGR